jgi:hypothetical protein
MRDREIGFKLGDASPTPINLLLLVMLSLWVTKLSFVMELDVNSHDYLHYSLYGWLYMIHAFNIIFSLNMFLMLLSTM